MLPPRTSSLDSAHDQNVGTTRPGGPDFFGVGVVVLAESIVPTRQPSQTCKDAVLDAAVIIVQATVREGESYL